jgi:hypothetical protein
LQWLFVSAISREIGTFFFVILTVVMCFSIDRELDLVKLCMGLIQQKVEMHDKTLAQKEAWIFQIVDLVCMTTMMLCPLPSKELNLAPGGKDSYKERLREFQTKVAQIQVSSQSTLEM